MIEPILNQSEVIIRKEDAKEYVSAGRYSSSLCLTNQRIITKRLFGGSAAYPLSHLIKADIAEYSPSPFALTNFHLLRLTFDNGGAILFGVSGDKNAWIHAIERAQVNAPELSYEAIPPQGTASSNPSPSRLLWVAAFAGFVLFILSTCTIALAVFILQLNSH